MNAAPSADVRPRRSGDIGIDEAIHPTDVIARPNLADAALVPETFADNGAWRTDARHAPLPGYGFGPTPIGIKNLRFPESPRRKIGPWPGTFRNPAVQMWRRIGWGAIAALALQAWPNSSNTSSPRRRRL